MKPASMAHINVLFSTYRPNLFKHLTTHVSQTVRNCTAVIAASVVKTTHRQAGLLSSTTLSHPQTNFLHETCIAGLVKHLSPYTGRTSEWMAFGQSFRPQKMNNTTMFLMGCFQRWRHHPLQMTSRWCNKIHSCYSEFHYVQNLYFWFFLCFEN